jgi:hypothetical protein
MNECHPNSSELRCKNNEFCNVSAPRTGAKLEAGLSVLEAGCVMNEVESQVIIVSE